MKGDTEAAGMTVGEAYLQALRDCGIRYVFANAGTDFAPVIEGMVRSNSAGREIPTFITVAHENVAVAMAQGYFKVTGEPAAVMVHVTVGTANALCGIMNAARDNVPMLLAAGRTPVSETGDIGSRNVPIHWGQESFDQGGTVREYVKWDYELRHGQPVEAVVGRALDVAMTDPMGPVYLTLPREVLGGDVLGKTHGKRPARPGAIPGAPSASAIEQVADILAAAENPVIVTGRLGTLPKACAALAELAEEHAIPVLQGPHSNLPSAHAMNLAGAAPALLTKADAIVVVESPVPWVPRYLTVNESATIVHIASDGVYAQYPFRAFSSDMFVTGTPVEALTMLRDVLKTKKKSAGSDARRKRLAAMRQEIEGNRAKTIETASRSRPIHPAWVAHCLNQVKADDALIVSELGVPPDYLQFSKAGCLLSGANAGGLGTGLGEALGAKLALPERQVISVVGDGSYMFGNPTAAHFVGRSANLPTLTMVMNNSMWFAVRRATLAMYPEGEASKANTMPLTELTPPPDYEKTIEACGGRGERIEDPQALIPALERALKDVGDGQQVLLNVVTQPGGRD